MTLFPKSDVRPKSPAGLPPRFRLRRFKAHNRSVTRPKEVQSIREWAKTWVAPAGRTVVWAKQLELNELHPW
jgi:hypothetical protein